MILNETLTIEQAIDIIKKKELLEFTEDAKKRVLRSQSYIEKAVDIDQPIYGVTTGVGANSTRNISKDDAKTYQEKLLFTHAVSVGEAISEEQVRAIMLMVILNGIKGYSGVRLETLEFYKEVLNRGLYPFVPGSGSVGYLNLEAHIALALIGKGKMREGNEWKDSSEVLKNNGLEPIELSYKEGLFLVSGTTSVTAYAAIAVAELKTLIDNYKLISAMQIEVSGATTRSLDPRLMVVRKQPEQQQVAREILDVLEDSEVCKEYYYKTLQSALSIRCIPQLIGPVLKKINQAEETVLREMDSCTDNPILFPEEDGFDAISGCNPDSSYIGLEMDTLSIAMCMLAKMSDRRTFRLLDPNLSNKPAFLVEGDGSDSGLMITQYTQAGLLNEMKINATAGVIDAIPTCANQEDYVAMGFNSSKKALAQIERLRYIMAIELLAVFQANRFMDQNLKRSTKTQKIYDMLSEFVPVLYEDYKLYPVIEQINTLLKETNLLEVSNK